ncbi:dolichol phosphate-mannose biosynthesis regulatory protein-like [Saccostrea echinata]|uniref:dolichol phosphate-mannose biosynthesis regulatory protein-like n=1 Tax=Saccostrea echinata TaxID=191078 RepID=UPI002A80DE04|nr:dolichol phosphate-mannose biosynthesis regulatory protein-like [Saccostrea echinata]
MDRLLGLSLISGSVTFGVYYTMWVIILPFVEKESLLQNFFPPKVFAVAIPLLIGVIGLIVIGLFASVTMLQKSRARKRKTS